MKFKIRNLEQSCITLRTQVSKLRTTNINIQKELDILKSNSSSSSSSSLSAIAQTSNQLTSSQPAQTDQPNLSSQPSTYSTIAGMNHQAPSIPSIENILKSVHLDLLKKSRKKANIVISGLDSSNECSDKEQAFRLLWNHWGTPIEEIAGCRRLGNHQEDKTRPLLVTLNHESIAEAIILQAKNLRHSPYHEVSTKIYINPDRTKAESLALYDLRQQRRDKKSAALASSNTRHDSNRSIPPSTTQHIHF